MKPYKSFVTEARVICPGSPPRTARKECLSGQIYFVCIYWRMSFTNVIKRGKTVFHFACHDGVSINALSMWYSRLVFEKLPVQNQTALASFMTSRCTYRSVQIY